MKKGAVLRALGMVLGIVLGSCSSETQSPLSLTPSPPQPDALVSAAIPAGLLEFTITASEPLPDLLQVEPITVVALPGQDPTALTRTYVSMLDDALVSLDQMQSLTLADYPEARISLQPQTSDQTYLLYQGDFPTVTFDDFVLVFSLSLLPEALRTPGNIVATANSLFPQRPQPYMAGDLDPVPNSSNTDYVAGGQVPAPDLEDVAAVYAAFLLPVSLRDVDTLSEFIEAIAPGLSVAPADIETIPGEAFPGEPIEVNTDQDSVIPNDSLCSLREAVDESDPSSCGSSQNVITFASNLTGSTITLNSTVTIDRDVDIQGLGSDQLEINGNNLSVGIFTIETGQTVMVEGLTLAAANQAINNQGELTLDSTTLIDNGSLAGGAILNAGTLTINQSTLSGNFAFGGGAIQNEGTLTVTESHFFGNTAYTLGAVINNEGSATISSSTLSGNLAFSGQGTGGGAGIIANAVGADLIVSNTTISDNEANVAGGGIFNDGGNLTVSNSTISGNTVTGANAAYGGFGGGIANSSSGNATIRNTTLTSNAVFGINLAAGGGIYNSGALTVFNTLVVGSQGNNCDGVAGLDGSTFDDDNSCGGAQFDPNANTIGVLAANGTTIVTGDPNGVTASLQTQALLPGNPAIDGGSNAQIPADVSDVDNDGNTAEPVPFDQRGPGFNRINGGIVDSGAFEL